LPRREFLTTLIFAYRGLAAHKLNLSRILVGAEHSSRVFSQLDPTITAARDELWRATENWKLRGERLEILISYFSGAADQARCKRHKLPSQRLLSYVNAAAMVVRGTSWHDWGGSLGYALTVLVHASVGQNNPKSPPIGADLYTAATDKQEVGSVPGLFAEASGILGGLESF